MFYCSRIESLELVTSKIGKDMSKKIAVLVGSLRRESFSKKVAKGAIELAPAGFEFEVIDLSELPVYNQDFDDDGNPPASYTKFRNQLKNVDGFLFVTPEYNRSVPAVLKNALDVGSRPYGQSVWDGKPGAIISQSPGGIAGFGANHHLRQSMVFLNVLLLQQPEAYLGHITNSLDDKGNISDNSTKDFLKNFMEAFAKWVDLIASK